MLSTKNFLKAIVRYKALPEGLGGELVVNFSAIKKDGAPAVEGDRPKTEGTRENLISSAPG